jgi:mannosyl-oligosaccharide alpha-1,2-mannosidase
VDAYGDHFLPHYPQNIPTFDPDISLLPEPESIYASINLKTHLHLPQSNAYPEARIGEIHNPPRNPPDEATKRPVPTNAYSQVWQGPEDWDKGGVEMPKVQARNFGGDRKLMKRRREAVKRGFAHAWQAYKDFAWGMCSTRARAAEENEADIDRSR